MVLAWFVDDDAITADLVQLCRSRTLAAGVDPFDYERVTSPLTSPRDWLSAFARLGATYARDAERAERGERTQTAAAFWRSAAALWHVATTLPHPDRAALTDAAQNASIALARYVELTDGRIHRLGSREAGYVGELRGPSTATTLAVVLPGLDSSRAEFVDLAEVLLARGVAVAAIDGPAQGELVDLPMTADYPRVVSALIDEILRTRSAITTITVVGLSLGGLYALAGALRESRIDAVATVSGPTEFPRWPMLPAFATDTIRLRTQGLPEARSIAAALLDVDLRLPVGRPLLIVSGTADSLPTPEQAVELARAQPHSELLLIDEGDHLCGNVRPQWIHRLGDWIQRIPG